MLKYYRNLLYIALAVIAFLLWTDWQRDHMPRHSARPAPASASAAHSGTNEQGLPPSTVTAASSGATQRDVPAFQATPTHRLVKVTTDVLELSIDRKGGRINEAKLLKYPVSVKEKNKPTAFLSSDSAHYFVANSGLLSKFGPDTQKGRGTFQAARSQYTLKPGQDSLTIPLTWQKNGVKVTKTFILKRGQYDVAVRYKVHNTRSVPWEGSLYAQIDRKKPESGSVFSFHTYTGAAISSAQHPYEKISYQAMNKDDLSRVIKGGWLAMQKRYFLAAWIPAQQHSNRYYSQVRSGDRYTIGVMLPSIKVNAGQSVEQQVKLYVGPEIADRLAALAPHLELTVDYGWLWIISVGLFWIMNQIYQLVGNWGVSIILVTLLIKLAFYKLSEKSYRSMAKMRKLAPQLEAVKKRCGDDRQKLSQETMALYRREKVNPLGGCLPMLIQIPIFFALYYVLIESVQLRQAPFVFWIQDLSTKDPFYVLPVLMGLSMLVQQKLNPTPPDPTQARIMMIMPVVFTVFFLAFPSGLVLYWLTNNVLSILQQWWIMKKVGA